MSYKELIPENRRLETYQALILKAAEELIPRGCEDLYHSMSDRNLSAQHAPERLGFRRTEYYTRLLCFFKVFKFRRDGVELLDGCRISYEEYSLTNIEENAY